MFVLCFLKKSAFLLRVRHAIEWNDERAREERELMKLSKSAARSFCCAINVANRRYLIKKYNAFIIFNAFSHEN